MAAHIALLTANGLVAAPAPFEVASSSHEALAVEDASSPYEAPAVESAPGEVASSPHEAPRWKAPPTSRRSPPRLPPEVTPLPQQAEMDAANPIVPGARLGREPDGQPAWFVADPARPDRYLSCRFHTVLVARSGCHAPSLLLSRRCLGLPRRGLPAPCCSNWWVATMHGVPTQGLRARPSACWNACRFLADDGSHQSGRCSAQVGDQRTRASHHGRRPSHSPPSHCSALCRAVAGGEVTLACLSRYVPGLAANCPPTVLPQCHNRKRGKRGRQDMHTTIAVRNRMPAGAIPRGAVELARPAQSGGQPMNAFDADLGRR